MPLTQRLKQHAFTQGLKDDQLSTLSKLATEVTFSENDLILMDGQRSTNFYLLLTGSVVVEVRTPVCVMMVQALGPGSVFGWSSLLDRQDTLFQVRARESSTAVQIDGPTLKEHCLSDAPLGAALFHRVLHVVAGRVKATELRFAEMCGIKI
jgi:CRP-like cAMP-binding protein